MPRDTPLRSFVRRDSRITTAQQAALDAHWQRFHLPDTSNSSEIAEQFPCRQATTLEVGSGDGTCILGLASANPHECFIAVEVYRPGLGRLLIGADEAKLNNLRVSDIDVYDVLTRFQHPVFDRVLVFFPDPWPKKRHHKRRLLQARFFETLAIRLKQHGRVFIATDCEHYALEVLELLERLPGWVNLSGRLVTAPRPKFRPVTKFEQRARDVGSTVYEIVAALR